MQNNTTKKGDCDCCDRTDVMLRLSPKGGMMQCDTCRTNDERTATENAKQVLAFSHKIDTLVELKADIYKNTTTSFIALQGAVQNNAEIPDEAKNSAILAEVDARIKVLTAAIFEHKAALVDIENERRALLTNAQAVVAKLRESERAKYKHFDVNYKPVTKVVKPKATKTPKASYKPAMVREFATKYGVDASMVQAIIVSRNLDPDAAAKVVAGMMGKPVA